MKTTAPGEGAAAGDADPTIPLAVLLPTDTLDELAHHIDGAFVLVVHITGDKHRRRCFLTAKAAERAARNAVAAGHNAQVFLAELKPLYRLKGSE